MLHSKSSYHLFIEVLWGSFVLCALVVLILVVKYVSIDLCIDFVFTHAYKTQGYFWRLFFYVYVLSLVLSIVSGVLLLIKGSKNIKAIYILSILLVGAPINIYLAYYISGGWLTSMAFLCIGICWLYSTWKSLYYYKNKLLKAHYHWLYKSFAFTFSPITLYLFIPILAGLTSLQQDEIYQISAWMSWLLNLIICEYCLINHGIEQKA